MQLVDTGCAQQLDGPATKAPVPVDPPAVEVVRSPAPTGMALAGSALAGCVGGSGVIGAP